MAKKATKTTEIETPVVSPETAPVDADVVLDDEVEVSFKGKNLVGKPKSINGNQFVEVELEGQSYLLTKTESGEYQL